MTYERLMKDMFKRFIVIDGPDGSGKTTQLEIIWKTITENKENKYFLINDSKVNKDLCVKMSFPEYDKPTGDLVLKMLHGEFGKDASRLNTYFTSPMYSIDRYQAMQRVFNEMDSKLALCQNKYELCLSSRYTISNLVHQGARLHNITEFMEYMSWLYDFEYLKLGLPVPDLNIYLVAPPKVSLNAILTRQEETGEKQDINETSDYLEEVYEHVNALRRFNAIPCTKYIDVTDSNGNMKPIDAVTKDIMKVIDEFWFNYDNTACISSDFIKDASKPWVK